MIHPLDVIATIPLKGRDSHAESMKKRPKTPVQIETPALPFDTQPIKIRRTVLPPRPNTALNGQPMGERISKKDGSYCKKFSDSTWMSNDVSTRDRSPTRDDIRSLEFKFEKNIEMVSGYQGVELAQRLQAVNDMLLDELVNQFRVINLGQGKLLEKSREVYARVFQILDDNAEQSAKAIIYLQEVAEKAEEEKQKTLDETKIRIGQIETECQIKVKEAQDKLDAKMAEFDENMKQFLDQKTQLEEHVKALHHVFLDFQSDAVYLTLEELKSKLSQANARVEKKEEANVQLQTALSKWKHQFQELTDDKKALEDTCKELRQEIQTLQNKNKALTRQVDNLKADLEAAKNAFEYDESDGEDIKSVLEELSSAASPMMNQQPDSINSSLSSASITPVKKTKQKKVKTKLGFGPGSTTPFMSVHQKLCKLGSFLSECIEKATGQSVMWNDQTIDEDEMQLLQRDLQKTERIIEQKVDRVFSIAELVTQIEGTGSKTHSRVSKEPRFVQFFSCGIEAAIPSYVGNSESVTNLYSEIRKLYQSKYLHDKWNQRSNRPLLRFPEFVVYFYYKDDRKIGTALHLCKKLWTLVEETKNSIEVEMFKDFLEEKLTLDELTFFLEMRHGILGLPVVTKDEPSTIHVQYTKCSSLMDRVLGAFSPISQLVGDEAQKKVKKGKIDHAEFLNLFIRFYSGEREKRKTAVQLLLQSKKRSDDNSTPIVLEIFVSILQGLGFQGSFEQVMEIYREARILSGGNDITYDGFVRAMDEMNVHFYSIDAPFDNDMSFEQSETARQMIMSHWVKFSQWFEGLRRSTTTLDTWVRSQLIMQVRQTDQTFQMNYPVASLYGELRNLLDLFQFALGLLSRGSPIPMKVESSEKQLNLLEDLNDLLLKFIVNAGTSQLQALGHKK